MGRLVVRYEDGIRLNCQTVLPDRACATAMKRSMSSRSQTGSLPSARCARGREAHLRGGPGPGAGPRGGAEGRPCPRRGFAGPTIGARHQHAVHQRRQAVA